MAVELYQQPQAPAPAAAPAPGTAASPRVNGRKKAAVLLVALGPGPCRRRSSSTSTTTRSSRCRWRWRRCSTSNRRHDHQGHGGAGRDGARPTTRSRPAASTTRATCSSARSAAERAAEIIGRLSSVIEMRPFEFLRRTAPEQIVAFLRNEAPQTIALVVANLHTTLAAQVLWRTCPRMNRPRSRCGSRRWARRALRSSSRSRT